MKSKAFVEVMESFDGLHQWPEAPNFLRGIHHHQFVVRLRVETIPGDPERTIEFFALKKQLKAILGRMFPDRSEDDLVMVGKMSCEMIADRIYWEVVHLYPERDIEISVHEDDYSGAIATFERESQ